MVRRKAQNQKGFTLVELLIVVAIIGVLATVGIPTFRRMIQRSKKSEAQVNLGNLFTIESAFLSEYGVYGNNLTAMGFQIDGAAATLTYKVGFASSAACAVIPTRFPNNTAAPIPAQSVAINNALPTYYAGIVAADHQMGRVGAAGTPNVAGTACTAALGSAGLTFNVSDVGVAPTFTALAAGYIQPGLNNHDGTGGAVGAGNAVYDQWVIDNARNLRNTADGVL
jgi:type IV pilus assembly protein PilA